MLPALTLHYVYVQVLAFKKMCRRMVMIEGEGVDKLGNPFCRLTTFLNSLYRESLSFYRVRIYSELNLE